MTQEEKELRWDMRAWEAVFTAVALTFLVLAPLSCCLCVLFLAISAGFFWLAWAPRALTGPLDPPWREALRVLWLASVPTAAGLIWLCQQPFIHHAPPMLLLPAPLAWQGGMLLVGLGWAAGLRRVVTGPMIPVWMARNQSSPGSGEPASYVTTPPSTESTIPVT